MKIYLLSDLHFGYRRKESYEVFDHSLENADIVVVTGDWDFIPYRPEELNDLRGDVEIVTVYGNHDDPNVLKYYDRIGSIKFVDDGDFIRVNDLTFCGFGGAVIRDDYSYPETWHTPEYYLQKYLELHKKLKENLIKCNILLTHEPTLQSVNDTLNSLDPTTRAKVMYNVDRKRYRNVFDTITTLLQPELHMSGHVHLEQPQVSKIRNYDIYNKSNDTIDVRLISMYGWYGVYDTNSEKVVIRKI